MVLAYGVLSHLVRRTKYYTWLHFGVSLYG